MKSSSASWRFLAAHARFFDQHEMLCAARVKVAKTSDSALDRLKKGRTLIQLQALFVFAS
jgi:hypothetical protein